MEVMIDPNRTVRRLGPAFLAAAAVAQGELGDGRYALANRQARRNLTEVPA
jgi:hypothetical protein